MLKKLTSILIAGIMISSVITGCGTSKKQESAPETKTEAQAETKTETEAPAELVTLVGSTTVALPAEELADVFMEKEQNITVEIQGVGSSAGIKAAYDKTADIGMSSRDLKKEEKDWGLTEIVVAYDGIAVVTHPNNPVKELTKDQIQKIFMGEINNWKEVGGNDAEIIVVTREAGSGTRDAFEEIVKVQKEENGKKISGMKDIALVAEGTGAVKANIASKEDAIGFVSLGYIDETVSAVKVDGVEATPEKVKEGTYPVFRPLLMLTNGNATAPAQKFIDFVLGDEGQQILSEKYISVK